MEIRKNAQDDNLFVFASQDHLKTSISLAGKPKRLSVEIVKRYFKNPYVVLATIVFIVVLLMSIIISQTATIINGPISTFDAATIRNLPPIGNDDFVISNVTQLDGNVWEILNTQATQNGGSPLILERGMQDLDGSFTFLRIDLSRLFAIQGVARPILGTNQGGSDVWIDSWAAAWESFKIALVVTSLESVIGISVGLYLGFHAGTWIDNVLTRFVDIIRSVPAVLWFIILVTALGTQFWSLVLAFIVIGWIGPVFNARLFIITVKDEEFITVAKSLGASTTRVIFLHAFPLIAGKIINSYIRRIPDVIFLIAALSFLGFDTGSVISLGEYLNQATQQLNIWTIIMPSLILLLFTLAIQFVSIGLHDALDPRLG